MLAPRYRNLIKTSIHSPRTVAYLARVAKALIDSGREDMFIGSLDKKHKVDKRALQNPTVYEFVKKRFKFLIKQDIWAFIQDLPTIHTDWIKDAKKLSLPVTIVIGEENKDQPPDAISQYIKAVTHAKLVTIKEAGTYQNLTHFNEIIQAVAEITASVHTEKK